MVGGAGFWDGRGRVAEACEGRVWGPRRYSETAQSACWPRGGREVGEGRGLKCTGHNPGGSLHTSVALHSPRAHAHCRASVLTPIYSHAGGVYVRINYIYAVLLMLL